MSHRTRIVVLALLALFLIEIGVWLCWVVEWPWQEAHRVAQPRQPIEDGCGYVRPKPKGLDSLPSIWDERYSQRMNLSWRLQNLNKADSFNWMSTLGILLDAEAHGVVIDSIFKWHMENALSEAFGHLLVQVGDGGSESLRKTARVASFFNSCDSLPEILNGMALIQERNWRECLHELDYATFQWPGSLRLRGMRGICMAAAGDHRTAIAEIPDLRSLHVKDSLALGADLPMVRVFIQWRAMAEIASHGLSAREFQSTLRQCDGATIDAWKNASDAYCRIQGQLHPDDESEKCRPKTEFEGKPWIDTNWQHEGNGLWARCPAWTSVRRDAKIIAESNACLFEGGATSGSVACPR